MTTPTKKNPRAGGRGGSKDTHGGERDDHRRHHATGPKRPPQEARLPRNWRDRLPAPEAYYRARVDALGARHGNGRAQGRCPFHDHHHASFSVRLDGKRGLWRFGAGCGHGDLVSFHIRPTGLKFVAAVRDLIGGVWARPLSTTDTPRSASPAER